MSFSLNLKTTFFVNRLTLIVILVYATKVSNSEWTPEHCNSDACLQIANELNEYINTSVNPCDNFYQFSCGKWIANHEIPNEEPSIDQFYLIENATNQELIELLDGDFTFGTASDKLRSVYKECRDTDRVDERGSTPVIEMLNSFGGWPIHVGDQWNETSFDWVAAIVRMRYFGFNYNVLMRVLVQPDERNNSINIVNLHQTALGLPSNKYYTSGNNNSGIFAYYSLMVKSAEKLGVDSERAQQQMMDALQFERQLATFSKNDEDLRNSSEQYNHYTKKQIIAMYPNLRFDELIDKLTNNTIPEDEVINVAVPSFFKQLNDLIPNVNKTVLANYILWRVLYASMAHLSSDWKQLYFEFNQALRGLKSDMPRPLFCMKRVSDNLHIALTSLYIQKNKERCKKIKEKSTDMVDQLMITVKLQLNSVKWMQPETKQKAVEKIRALLFINAFPNEDLNAQLIDEYFSKLALTGEYYEDYFKSAAFSTEIVMQRLHQRNERVDYKKVDNLLQCNAYNDLNNNVIVMMLGILRGYIFDEERSICRNMPAIGAVIGHEVAHAFDDEGKQYDKYGNLHNWWDDKTDKAFSEKQQCVIDQYNSYYVPELNMTINGKLTQGENIADIAGSKTAYKTYKRVKKQCGCCSKKCVKYSSDQLFWIHYAMLWCSKTTKQHLIERVLADVHSLDEFRVNGPLSDHPEFAKSFNCPTGSPMNPEKKCSFW